MVSYTNQGSRTLRSFLSICTPDIDTTIDPPNHVQRRHPRGALQYSRDENTGETDAKAACHSTAEASAEAGELLRDPGILQEVCKHLIGHSLYVSLVCKGWQRCYELAAAESELALAAERRRQRR
jgi:hypothetical protein